MNLKNLTTNYPNFDALHSEIINILDKKFVNYTEVAHILALSIFTRQNAVLFGPAGHGKSEMVEAVLEGLGLWDRTNPNTATLIQSFGEGLSEDQLWGGLDFSKLNHPSEAKMEYNVENSFLNYEVAVFEELFDAPPFTLLPLKHTLQAGFLAKNGKNFPMNTQIIIACTNKDPKEIEEMGETYRALLERFPLRLYVTWDKYDATAFSRMLRKHPAASKRMDEKTLILFSNLLEECRTKGDIISPRTAMKACTVLCNVPPSGQKVTYDHFGVLRHVSGFERAGSRILDEINQRAAEAEATLQLQKLYNEYEAFKTKINEYNSRSGAIKWLQAAKEAEQFETKFNKVKCPESLFAQRSGYVAEAGQLIENCKATGFKLVKLDRATAKRKRSADVA